MLTVIILTKNEEKNIAGCLESVRWADEIIVIDDNSTDKTVGVIRGIGPFDFAQGKEIGEKVKIYTRDLNGDFAGQRNFGLEKASGEWVLFVDADERVSSELKEEIISVTTYKYPTTKGFYLKRDDKIFGRVLRHGETADVRLLRLGRKDSGFWEGKVHEVWKIKGDTGELKNPLLHLPHPTISELLEEINNYSTIRAEELYSLDKKTNLLEILCYPMAKFFQDWIFKMGLLDGMPGFTVAVLMSFHSFLVRSKLYLLWKQGGEWN